MITILATIFVFGLLVFVHEFGHFAVAKISGMKVTEFAIGFGPSLFKKQEGETLYSIRIIPLGGYNKIAGMDPDDPEDPRNFDNQSVFKRLCVIVAGSFMNLILPVVIFFFIISFSGIQKPIDEPILGKIVDGRAAAIAGLKENDRILEVDGVKVTTWANLVDQIRVKPNQQVALLLERDGKQLNIKVIPQYDDKNERGIIGVIAKSETLRPGLVETIKLSFMQTYLIATEMVKGIYQLITGTQPADIAGPLGVAQMAGQVASYGILPLLNFAALLSINLGLINLLPVPLLDGGHVVTLLIEGIRGKSLNPDVLYKVQMIGLVLLLSLFIFATFKDLARFNIF